MGFKSTPRCIISENVILLCSEKHQYFPVKENYKEIMIKIFTNKTSLNTPRVEQRENVTLYEF